MPRVSDSYLQARREQILDAAEACFSRNGLRETTMQDIAREAGVSYGVVYRYFPSKEELFRAAALAAQASREGRFREASRQSDALGALKTALQLALDRWRDPASIDELRMRLQVLAEAAHDESFQNFVREGLEMYWSLFDEIVRRGQRDGEIDASLDPGAVAQLLFALQEGFTEQKAIVPGLDIDAYQHTVALVLERTLSSPDHKEAADDPDQS